MLSDEARCTGENCPHRDVCSRYCEQRKNHPNQSWIVPPEQVCKGEFCSYFLPAICYGDNCVMRDEKGEDENP